MSTQSTQRTQSATNGSGGWTGTVIPEGVHLERLEGGLGVIEGLRAAAVSVGVRDSAHRDPHAPDVALLDVGRSVPAAIVTTTNQVRAAPCVVGVEHVADGTVRAVIVNSGNANACTGARGLEDARAMASAVGAALGCPSSDVVPMSTGVIGVPLPVERIVAGVTGLVQSLAPGAAAAAGLARAMMTTDSIPKQVAVRVTDGSQQVLVAGVAKGAGMIEPAMATMLSVIVTDAQLTSDACHEILSVVTQRTFNRISVDSCGSTNDTVLLIATGTGGRIGAEALTAAVEQVAAELAHMIVTDGEGVTRVARLRILGAPDVAAAHEWGGAIAASALFRTALHGSDPNWGRILAAMGTTSTPFDPSRVDVRFGPVTVCSDGGAVPYDHDAAVEVLREAEVAIDVDLKMGDALTTFLVADLSAGYVHVNAEYTT
jgi:glutamate N-acetyltransferase / amino-acid N-acetyltransferase